MNPRSVSEPPVRPAAPFHDLGLTPALQKSVRAAGYTTPTPIQGKAIPLLLDGRDVLGCAQTGTGKTAAFALPILQHLGVRRSRGPRGAVRALVLAPTRELAAQIGESFGRYAAGTPLRHLVIFGGVGKDPQIRGLARGVDVLIATPGRLLDLMSGGAVSLGAVEHVVLDEADRMLDMGFIHDIRRVLAALPERRQTLLFSATLPAEIEALARRFLRDPERVAVDPVSSTCEPIEQSVYFVDAGAKTGLLVELLQDGAIDRALIFTRTKHGANRLAQKLTRAGIPASAIHGNKSQSARERTLVGLRSGETRVVVATDLASRGLDVKGLSHVVNFDLPNEPETYVHRVGRTGRAGESGVAVALCAPDEQPYLRAIERLIGKTLVRRNAEPKSAPSGRGTEAARVAPAAEDRPAPRAGKSARSGRGGVPPGADRAVTSATARVDHRGRTHAAGADHRGRTHAAAVDHRGRTHAAGVDHRGRTHAAAVGHAGGAHPANAHPAGPQHERPRRRRRVRA